MQEACDGEFSDVGNQHEIACHMQLLISQGNGLSQEAGATQCCYKAYAEMRIDYGPLRTDLPSGMCMAEGSINLFENLATSICRNTIRSSMSASTGESSVWNIAIIAAIQSPPPGREGATRASTPQ